MSRIEDRSHAAWKLRHYAGQLRTIPVANGSAIIDQAIEVMEEGAKLLMEECWDNMDE